MATTQDQVSENPQTEPTQPTSPQPAADPPQNKPSSGKKVLKITGIVVAVLVVLFVLIGIFAPASVPKYSTSDLVTETKDNISFSRPSQWKDVSGSDTLKNSFGMNVNDSLIFGDKITKDKNGKDDIANAGVIFGKASEGKPADVALLKDPAVRTQFEKTMDSSLQKDSFKSSECQSIDHFSKNYNYDLNNFPVSVALNINCHLSAAEQKKQKAQSIEIRMAIIVAKNGNTYAYVLFANDKSWAKNEPVYLQMLKDLKAQP